MITRETQCNRLYNRARDICINIGPRQCLRAAWQHAEQQHPRVQDVPFPAPINCGLFPPGDHWHRMCPPYFPSVLLSLLPRLLWITRSLFHTNTEAPDNFDCPETRELRLRPGGYFWPLDCDRAINSRMPLRRILKYPQISGKLRRSIGQTGKTGDFALS